MTHSVLSSLRAGVARLLAVAAILLFCGGAIAQVQTDDDAKLNAFVEAVAKLAQVRQSWIPKMKSATSEEDKRKLGAQALQAMRAAVDGVTNMTVDQYNAIVAAAKTDDALRTRIDDKFKKKAGGQ